MSLDKVAPTVTASDGSIWHRITIRMPDGVWSFLLFVFGAEGRIDRTEFDGEEDFDAWVERLTSAGPDAAARP